MDFCKDFGGFWDGKWSQVGTKTGSNIGFPETNCLAELARLLRWRSGGSKLGVKIDPKSIKK